MRKSSTELETAFAVRPTARVRRGGKLWLALGLLSCLHSMLGPPVANAEPLDLFDPRPREVVVRFETSPRDLPAQLDTTYSPDFRAFVEKGLRTSELRVVIPAITVETFLLSEPKPIPGSFSDFVWTFDIETGHVISAHLTGDVRPRLDWGFMTSETRAQIEIEMGTARTGGFKRPLRVLGQLVFRYCTEVADSSCRFVEAKSFDPATGYVNAVGRVWVHSTILDLWNFSPMGEAVFREAEPTREALAQEKSAVEFSLPTPAPELAGVVAPAAGGQGSVAN